MGEWTGEVLPPLREPRNVPELKARDALVRRVKALRASVVLDRADLQHWNRMNPDKKPLCHAFEDAMIAWCDGLGPMPALPPAPEGTDGAD